MKNCMDTGIIITTILFLCTGFLFVGLSIPLINRKIPPNNLYGFRVPETLNNRELWYDVNEYSARLMRNIGYILLATVQILLLLRTDPTVFALLLVGILLTGTILMVILTYKYMRTIQNK